MMGRYGNDKMNQVLSVVSLVLVLLGVIFGIDTLYNLGMLMLAYLYFRMLSRNIPKRYAENQAFLRHYYRVTNWFSGKKHSLERNKDYKIFSCPACKQKLRVPKGKGKIQIRCSKCGNEFIKRS